MKNILLVEDDVEISNLLSLHLQSENCQFKTCGRGDDAVRELSGNAYDLVILDINLPILMVWSCARMFGGWIHLHLL